MATSRRINRTPPEYTHRVASSLSTLELTSPRSPESGTFKRLSRVIFGETQCFLWDFERYVDAAFQLNTDQPASQMFVISPEAVELPATPLSTPPASIADPTEAYTPRRRHQSLRHTIKRMFTFRKKNRRMSNPLF